MQQCPSFQSAIAASLILTALSLFARYILLDRIAIAFWNFRPAAEEELWQPEGARYINGELVLERPTYDGEPVPIPRQRFTLEEKMQLLDYHPLFTGECPECGYHFDMENPPPVHWDCPACAWCDNSV